MVMMYPSFIIFQLQFQILTAEIIEQTNMDDKTAFETFIYRPDKVIWELLILSSQMDTHLKHIQVNYFMPAERLL